MTLQCFVDLAGTVPAKVGDKVALCIQTEPQYHRLVSPNPACRPTLCENDSIEFSGEMDGGGEHMTTLKES